MTRVLRRSVFAIAVVLLGCAIAWNPLVEPLLVRFPTDLDETIRYEGTFEVAADPATLTPLPEPLLLPLKVERRVHVADSSFRTVVVREDLTMHVGDLPPAVDRLSHEMDRRTMKLVDGPDSWTYERSHVVPRRGSYRVNFPMNTEPGRDYRIWANETDTFAVLSGGGDLDTIEGIDVLRFSGGVDDAASDAYARALVDKGFAAGRDYLYTSRDEIAVEPRTGAQVSHRSTETVRVRHPDGSTQRIYTARYGQTPASVAEIADDVRAQLRLLRVVQAWAPLSLLTLGLALLVVAGVLTRRAGGAVARNVRRRGAAAAHA